MTTGRLFASPFSSLSSRFCLPPGGKPGLPGHDGEAVCKSIFQDFFEDFASLLEGSQACLVTTGRLLASPLFKIFLKFFAVLLEGSQACLVMTGRLFASPALQTFI